MNWLLKLFVKGQQTYETGKYSTVHSAVKRHILELEKQGKPINKDTAAEKILSSGLSMRALATRNITRQDVLREAGILVKKYQAEHRVLSFKE